MKVLYICHDASLHGAQLLSLNILTTLKKMGYGSVTLMLSDGELLKEFERVTEVIKVWQISEDDLNDLLLKRAVEFQYSVLANTTVSGMMTEFLYRRGYTVTSLVHELPTTIKNCNFESFALNLAKYSAQVIFPSSFVTRGFANNYPLTGSSLLIPQGLYMQPRTSGNDSIRAELGIKDDAAIVIGVGFGEYRKGVDLFIQVAIDSIREHPNMVFIWVGELHLHLREWFVHDVLTSGLQGNIHFVGKRTDVASFYDEADVLLMTSREDPFPSTVLEAMSFGVPVVGFRDAGGFEDIVSEQCGELVRYLDTKEMSKAVQRQLGVKAKYGSELRGLIASKYSFDSYVRSLYAIYNKKFNCSVVVPNYNYSELIYERLKSIAEQTLAPKEIIILDDCSSDGSDVEIQRFIEDYGRVIETHYHKNTINSGSVFKQWAKGVALASEDIIWIAEADDVCSPHFIQSLLPAFVDQQVVLSYCQSSQINQASECIAENYFDYTNDICPEHWKCSYVSDGVEEIVRYMSVKNTIPNASAVMFRRPENDNIFQGLESYHVAGDWLFYTELLAAGKVSFNADVHNHHRRHESSQTRVASNSRHFSEVVAVQNIIDSRYELSEEVACKREGYNKFLERYFDLTLPL
jgi:glycosyltransferase involved in cell wall biosynthesis